MKKTAFLIVTLLTISQVSLAQSNLKFGVKAGLNYANFTNTDVKTDAITSYHAGILMEFSLFDNLAIQPELLYSTVGASYDNLTEQDFNNIKSLFPPMFNNVLVVNPEWYYQVQQSIYLTRGLLQIQHRSMQYGSV